MTEAPRISPGGRRDVGLFAYGFARVAGVVTRSNPPNLFLTMGRAPKLFRGWLRFAGRLMPGGRLPRRETELVILRVAHLRGCAYEFEHHVRLSRRVGVGSTEIDQIVQGPSAAGWTERDRAVLTAVDELVATKNLSDPTWDALRTHLDEPRAIEFILLVGHYEMLATFLLTLRVQPDHSTASMRTG